MIKKRWMMACFTLLIAIALVGCSGGNGGGSATNGGGTGDANSNDAGQGGEVLDKATFTYFNAFSGKDVETNQTTIGKILEDQTGVNFKIEHAVGDVNTKVGTMIAGNDYPDVLVPDVAIDKVMDAGAFIPLNELIDQYGPNIKRVYEPYYNLMKAEDGNIYFLPFSPIVGEEIPNPNGDDGAFWIQRRVLKEFGYPKVKTLDEYFDLIEKYAAKYPEEKLTGFLSLTHDWRFFAITNPPNHLMGYPNDGGVMVDMETYEANDYADDEATKRWLKKLNELNAKGLYDKSSFIDNYDQYIEKLTSGKVLGYFDYGWQAGPATNNLKQAGDDDLRYFQLPLVFDEGIKDQYLPQASFTNNRGIGITISAKDPVRIIQFFDKLLTDENQVLSNWGVKGETYDVDENGMFYRTPEQIAQTTGEEFRESFGLKYFEYGWPRYGNGSTLADGNSSTPGRQPSVAAAAYTEGDKLILEKYGATTFSDLFTEQDYRPWFPAWSIAIEQGSPADIFNQKKSELQKKYFPKMVLAEPDKFESVWEEYIREFNKLDVAAYEKTMTEKIKEKVAVVTGK